VLIGSFGADTLYGDAGNDVIVFSGGSNVWDYKAGTTTARGAHKSGIDQAAGGSGKYFFVFDQDFLVNKALTKLTGSAFITALNLALKPDGIQMAVGRNGFTSNNTTLFIQEAAVDTNGNSKTNDTLLEIQLVGITSSAISMKMFADTPLA